MRFWSLSVMFASVSNRSLGSSASSSRSLLSQNYLSLWALKVPLQICIYSKAAFHFQSTWWMLCIYNNNIVISKCVFSFILLQFHLIQLSSPSENRRQKSVFCHWAQCLALGYKYYWKEIMTDTLQGISWFSLVPGCQLNLKKRPMAVHELELW